AFLREMEIDGMLSCRGKPRAGLFKRKGRAMRIRFRNLWKTFGPSRHARPPTCRLRVEYLDDRCLLSRGFVQTALVSDIAGLAPHTDPALQTPWGFTVASRGDFLISDNNGGNAALFAADGNALGAPIVMPPPGGSPADSSGTPTGQVLNATSDFVIREG